MMTEPTTKNGIPSKPVAPLGCGSLWTAEIPTVPGWYWLRHAVFRGKTGAWHEVHPIIVELGQNGNAPMMIFVSGSEWVRSLEDLVVGEWAGPLTVPH